MIRLEFYKFGLYVVRYLCAVRDVFRDVISGEFVTKMYNIPLVRFRRRIDGTHSVAGISCPGGCSCQYI